MLITPVGSCVGTAALVLLSHLPSPLGCFFCWFYSQWGFHSQQRKGSSGKVWGLPFIGSPLTWKLGNGMFHMLTDGGVAFSFI